LAKVWWLPFLGTRCNYKKLAIDVRLLSAIAKIVQTAQSDKTCNVALWLLTKRIITEPLMFYLADMRTCREIANWRRIENFRSERACRLLLLVVAGSSSEALSKQVSAAASGDVD